VTADLFCSPASDLLVLRKLNSLSVYFKIFCSSSCVVTDCDAMWLCLCMSVARQ